jgi:hypothetical protein
MAAKSSHLNLHRCYSYSHESDGQNFHDQNSQFIFHKDPRQYKPSFLFKNALSAALVLNFHSTSPDVEAGHSLITNAAEEISD